MPKYVRNRDMKMGQVLERKLLYCYIAALLYRRSRSPYF